MANFYKDNDGLKFQLSHPLMKKIVDLKERNYADKDKYDYAAVDFDDAIDNYDKVLEIVGEICGETLAPNAEGVDHDGPTVENNRVILCDSHELFKHEVTAKDACFVAVDKIDAPITVQAKARYSQKVQSATATQLDENTLHVVFDEPVRAPAPGQALVLYDGERVIGGGTIV